MSGWGESPSIVPADDGSRRGRARLAIAYDITSSSPMAVAGLLSDLCDIVWIVDNQAPSLGAMGRLLPRLGTVVDTSGRDPSDLIDRLAAESVDGVIAFTDSQLPLAGWVAEQLGVVGNPPPVIDRLVDKHVQRAALGAAGVWVPRFRLLRAGTDADAVAAQVAELTFPLVAKPLRGDSSRDVRTIADLGELNVVLGCTGDERDRPDLLVEEYISDGSRPECEQLGRYVSVESVVRHGVPTAVAITGKFPLVEPFRESGNFMPHPLVGDEAAAVLDLSTRAALALGVETGALHTEIKLSADGPRVIEVNGRIGGGAIDNIFTRRTGSSLTELAARVALGQPVELIAEQPTTWSGPFIYEFFVQPPKAAVRFVAVDGAGRIVGTVGAETVALNRAPGDQLDWRTGSQDYVLQAGGVALDRSMLTAVPLELVAAAAIDYEFG